MGPTAGVGDRHQADHVEDQLPFSAEVKNVDVDDDGTEKQRHHQEPDGHGRARDGSDIGRFGDHLPHQEGWRHEVEHQAQDARDRPGRNQDAKRARAEEPRNNDGCQHAARPADQLADASAPRCFDPADSTPAPQSRPRHPAPPPLSAPTPPRQMADQLRDRVAQLSPSPVLTAPGGRSATCREGCLRSQFTDIARPADRLVIHRGGALRQDATVRRSETTLRYISSIFVAASTQEYWALAKVAAAAPRRAPWSGSASRRTTWEAKASAVSPINKCSPSARLDTLRAEAGGHDGLSDGKRLDHLEPRSSTDSHRHHHHRGPPEIGSHVRDDSGEADSRALQVAHCALAIAHDGQGATGPLLGRSAGRSPPPGGEPRRRSADTTASR